jgi:hypothetical protein
VLKAIKLARAELVLRSFTKAAAAAAEVGATPGSGPEGNDPDDEGPALGVVVAKEEALLLLLLLDPRA